MKVTLKPLEIPFRVGDTVFVNLPYSSLNTSEQSYLLDDKSYFEATIVRIFLQGLQSPTVVATSKEFHELAITNLVYDLKLVEGTKGNNRVPLVVDLASTRKLLFATEQELTNYLLNGEHVGS
ncbi:hypothetical protein ACAW74_18255 [Fibrella sp. WM1]|uniref:hypothetical protein n=1 Tax=Fibrella musci TaxID=3242485 RepID=UPI00351FC018